LRAAAGDPEYRRAMISKLLEKFFFETRGQGTP
ncbi:MAG: hypothetical protein JWN04_3394, partial [Myxococcaceae bacterium]|nr:hypothetical protein [Myxococcaceae bacterium]